MPWDKDLTSLVGDIENEFHADSERTALYALERAQDISPVGNPRLWKNPESAPAGYVGGRFRQSWQIDQTEDGFLVSNPQPYGPRLDDGHSSQAPDGILDLVVSDLANFE